MPSIRRIQSTSKIKTMSKMMNLDTKEVYHQFLIILMKNLETKGLQVHQLHQKSFGSKSKKSVQKLCFLLSML